MQPAVPLPAHARSPFVAAFLSFLFPGLGQAYAGYRLRAVVLAAPLVLVLALIGGMLVNRTTREWLLSQFASTDVLTVALIINLLLLVYRVVVIVDAYRLAQGGAVRPAAPRRPSPTLRPMGVVGLLAVLAVTPLLHVGVARYNLVALDALNGITGDSSEPSLAPGATDTPGSGDTPGSTTTPGSTATAVPAPQWDSTSRLNILLVGVDQRAGDSSFNTDTMIVASIDPVTNQVGMFSLPRDTEGVPLPAAWPAHGYYANGVYPGKINSLWARAAGNPGLFPFPGSSYNRGMQALKGALGALYQLNIQYYIAVNFQGFENIIDTLGGVTVDVQMPVTDDALPVPGGLDQNLYVAPGIQHMTGQQALGYARSRHASSDFDRAQRQQRVILSVRQQTDLASLLLNIDSLQALVNDLKGAFHTDIPSSLFPKLADLGQQLDLTNLRSLVFTPPKFAVECNNPALSCYYSLTAKVAPIRAAVKDAFSIPAALAASRQKVQAEGATVDVLNGTSNSAVASNVVAWLGYQGLDAEVSTFNGGHATTLGNPQTIITVYNGAEADLPETIKLLQAQFGVTVVTKADPTVTTADFILVETGTQTPNFTTPSG